MVDRETGTRPAALATVGPRAASQARTLDEAPARGTGSRLVSAVLDQGPYVALAGLVIYLSFASPFFLTTRNLLNVGEAVSVIGIVAAGLTFALIAGQLDLSVGSVIGLTTVVIALFDERGMPIVVAVAVALVAALAVGIVNSFVVVTFGVNSIITTLAMLTVVFGVALILAEGQTMIISSSLGPVFARPLGIPVPLLLLVAVYAVLGFVLYRTRLGWHVYAVGGNATAAARSGVRTQRIHWLVFLTSATLAWVGGIITAAQTSSASANFGTGRELDALTAVLIGGIALEGGRGRIGRTLAGVLLIGVLGNGLVLLDVESYYQRLIQGAMLLLAVLLDSIRAKRASR